MNISNRQPNPDLKIERTSREHAKAFDRLRGSWHRFSEGTVIDQIVNRTGPGSLRHDIEHTVTSDATPTGGSERRHIRLR